jgi:DNA-binding NtrC family response regulator
MRRPSVDALTMSEGRHQILVVDDNHEFCMLMRDYLSHLNYNVIYFTSATEALDCLKSPDKRPIDLILTELHLRGMEPADFLSVLQGFGIPVIVVTSFDAGATEAKKRGVAGFLVKPFPLMEIATLVEKALS